VLKPFASPAVCKNALVRRRSWILCFRTRWNRDLSPFRADIAVSSCAVRLPDFDRPRFCRAFRTQQVHVVVLVMEGALSGTGFLNREGAGKRVCDVSSRLRST